MNTARTHCCPGIAGSLLALLLFTAPGAGAGPAADAPAPLRLRAELGSAVLAAGTRQPAYLRVGLTGLAPEAREPRAPVNLALVIDCSGSMAGDKIQQVRDAAGRIIGQMMPDDTVSCVAYGTEVEVVCPATRLTDPAAVAARIRGIEAQGSTALFAGVSKAAAEVRKFLAPRRVNRILLVSDGMANSGPGTPAELGLLGASLGREGISVSTIGLGLGYNEDLMVELAARSDGSHYFAQSPADLQQAFDAEFGRMTSVAAQGVQVRIDCAPGLRPLRVVGREAEIAGGSVVATLNQLYRNHEKYLVLEMESDALTSAGARPVATVSVRYRPSAGGAGTLREEVQAAWTGSPGAAEEAVDPGVMADVVELIGVEKNRQATLLRDQGRTAEARQALVANQAYLAEYSRKLQSRKLEELGIQNDFDARNLETKGWPRQRKVMRENQTVIINQQNQK